MNSTSVATVTTVAIAAVGRTCLPAHAHQYAIQLIRRLYVLPPRRNETKRNETKRNETKRNEPSQDTSQGSAVPMLVHVPVHRCPWTVVVNAVVTLTPVDVVAKVAHDNSHHD